MTTDALATVADRLGGQQGDRLEAVVAVEQARAVAQVAAQVQVAQRFPRDMERVRAELDDACEQYELAAEAFWALPNRGQGMTVHVARELAVIWGNVDYGVAELRRDDERQSSEIQAFCWDMQRNSRATRTFQVPHAETVNEKLPDGRKRKIRRPIVDLDDVYRNNQSVGAKAMRECVFGTLPRSILRTAERKLRETLRRGPGTPIGERRDLIVNGAKRFGITREQLERRVGRPVARWDEEDVAALEVVAATIARGETTAAEQFDDATARVTVDELDSHEVVADALAGQATDPEPVGDMRPATREQVTKVILMLKDLGTVDDDAQRQWLERELRRPVDSRNSLTRGEASTVIDVLQLLLDEQGTPGGEQ